MGENIYMLPSDMNLKIKTDTVGYNNKILVSDGNFSLGKNDEVNTGSANSLALEEPVIPCKPTHEDEKIALVLFPAGGFTIWNIF